jgi:hypothetical protein
MDSTTKPREESEMLTYPEGMLAISSQHRKELLDEAQRWQLVKTARRARRDRRAPSNADYGDCETDNHGRPGAREKTRAGRGRIAGWVAAGGRGRVEIVSPETGTLAACGPRAVGPAR